MAKVIVPLMMLLEATKKRERRPSALSSSDSASRLCRSRSPNLRRQLTQPMQLMSRMWTLKPPAVAAPSAPSQSLDPRGRLASLRV